MRTRSLSAHLLALVSLLCLPFQASAADAKPSEGAPRAEENLLAPQTNHDGLDRDKPELVERSFGEELMRLGINVSWSGLGAVIFNYEPGGSVTFNDATFHPILTAKIGSNLVSEVEFEIDPHGVMAHYAVLDYILSSAFTIRVGKFLTPVGRFNEVLHPVFRWETVTYPLMFGEVIPAIWSEHGIQFRGSLPLGMGAAADYALFVSNGMAMSQPTMTTEHGGMDMSNMSGMTAHGMAGMTVGPSGYMRTLTDNVIDNNKDKAFGGRIGASLFTDSTVGATKLGVSGYTAALDNQARRRLTIVDADFSIRLGDLTLRTEAAQTFIGSDKDLFQEFERGIYVQASYRIGRFQLTGRWDWSASWDAMSVDSLGNIMTMTMTMPGDTMPMEMIPSMVIQRQGVFCLMYSPSPLWSLRAEVRFPLGKVDGRTGATADGAGLMPTNATAKYAAMVSFYF